jgi:branched-chain amino acid transport system substrate-binding protein
MTASSIFICYRRDDSASYGRNVCVDLQRLFPNHHIFMDLGVGLGEDYVEHIERAIAGCEVLLVLIGPGWASAADESGRPRLDDPEDLVRLEIATALRRGVIVIPLFVRGAAMPKASDLPEPLVSLRRRNGLALRDERWDDDIAAVARTLDARLSVVKTADLDDPPTPTPASSSILTLPESPQSPMQPGPVLAMASLRRASRDVSVLVSRGARKPLLVGAALVALVVVIGLLLTQGEEQRKVRIGALYSLTGTGSDAGKESLRGVEFAADYLSAAGYPDLGLSLRPGDGLPHLGGAKLEIVDRDVKGHSCNAGKAMGELVGREHVAAVVGAYESTVTQQAIVAANHLHIPLVNDTATAWGLTKRDEQQAPARMQCDTLQEDPTPSKWFSRVGGNDHQYAGLFEGLIEDQAGGVGIGKVAVLHVSGTAYGTAGVGTAKALAKDLGVRGKDFESFGYTLDDPDSRSGCPGLALRRAMTHAVKRLRIFHPDVVLAFGYLPDAVLAVKTMAQQKYTAPALLAFGAGYEDPGFISKVRTSACGMKAADPRGIITRSAGSWPTDADARQAARRFKQRFKADMTDTTARAFTATIALATAIDEAQSTDPQTLQAAIRHLKIADRNTILTTDTGIRFDTAGQNTGARGVLLQIRGKHARSAHYAVVYPHDHSAPGGHGSATPLWPLARALN